MQETEESGDSEKDDKKTDKRNDRKKTKEKAKKKEKPAKETKGKKNKEVKDEEGEEEMEAEDEDEDEGSGNESDAFDNGEAGDEYMLVLYSVKNKRASHMMGDPSVSILNKSIGSLSRLKKLEEEKKKFSALPSTREPSSSCESDLPARLSLA